MIGDKIIIKPEHKKKAEVLLKALKKKYKLKGFKKGRLIVSIGGSSGASKTEVALILQENLWVKYKIRSKIIHIDDYYKILWQKRNEIRKKKGINSVGINEIEWHKLKRIIRIYKSYAKKNYCQRIHRWMDTMEYVIFNNRCCDLLIIEGLYGCYLKKLELVDFAVHLDGTPKQTLEFRKERSKENPDDDFRKAIVEKEYKDVIKLKKYADLVINWEV